MVEQILSSMSEAQKESNNLRARAAAITTSYTVARGATNLTIIDNIDQLASGLCQTCANYQQLVNSQADSIGQLAQQFAETDTHMAGEM